jgi:hypothetical protein
MSDRRREVRCGGEWRSELAPGAGRNNGAAVRLDRAARRLGAPRSPPPVRLPLPTAFTLVVCRSRFMTPLRLISRKHSAAHATAASRSDQRGGIVSPSATLTCCYFATFFMVPFHNGSQAAPSFAEYSAENIMLFPSADRVLTLLVL